MPFICYKPTGRGFTERAAQWKIVTPRGACEKTGITRTIGRLPQPETPVAL